ncbi:selenocysteine-specific translation elongation factor [Ktedonospora formicarum]|uniref:Selenocysteine-specific elongation factor n=1 Tax=Ktedonospora formicarum TaxID=2778364 RepID=A0A8J3HTU0_9CHLR|nr:selenocysteine-specific translation elongation factor [Ktedonospora formicarum]GHO43877.1 selenocysteine-specific translation factor [Ktedonospora formicarum]
MSCIGTAGHVDHGKSALVQALTGIDPDRLAEEKARGMTIDLGFAWLTLPHGREVSIIDVPGHEDFIKNMLAGVGGIDAALLVVAADEGIMPQTREHLAILDLLRVSQGVVALTKADLVDDEWLELVREEIAELIRPTTLAQASILPVSAYTGKGLPQLLAELERLLDSSEERQDIARPRLPIDRVFTLTGFGTVVTGTLLDGSFRLGQEIEILPGRQRTRIRGLQMHKQSIESTGPGHRVAINLPNISRSDLKRGDVVTLPGQLRSTVLLDARISLLADAERSLTHNTQVEFYCGSQEIPARVRLLDTEELMPGESAWVQLRFSRPAVAARRDAFVLRIPSPSFTIGGGEVIDVRPRYHRRFQRPILEALERLRHGLPEELVLVALDRRTHASNSGNTGGTSPKVRPTIEGYDLAEVARLANLAEDVTGQVLKSLLLEGRVRHIRAKGAPVSGTDDIGEEKAGLWFARSAWDAFVEESVRLVASYHRQYPLREGFSKEEWRSRLHLTPRQATELFAVLVDDGVMEAVALSEEALLIEATRRSTGLIRLPGFQPTFTPEQRRQVDALEQAFRRQPYGPPVRAEAEKIAEPEVIAALIGQGTLVKLGEDVLFLRTTYDEAVSRLTAYLRAHGTMTAAEARDALGTSRKYVLPLLEHLDLMRVTKRVGDVRQLASEPKQSIS